MIFFAYTNVYKGLLVVKVKNSKFIFCFFCPKCCLLINNSYICSQVGTEP